MINVGGFLVAELHGSGKGHADANDVSEIRRFRCSWSDRFGFRDALLGITQGSTVRNPMRHPENNLLFVVSVDTEPYQDTKTTGTPSGSDPAIQYEWALVTVTYKPRELSGSISSPELYTETYDFNAEFLTRPIDGAIHEGATASTTLPPGFSLGALMPGLEYEYTRQRMRSVPLATIYTRLGKVNNDTFLEAEAEHVLYVGARCRSFHDSSGQRLWEVTHRFAIRGDGTWNEFFLPGQGWGLVRPGPAQPFARIYEMADLRPLIEG